METSKFEGKKVALKQTKDGHVLTIAIHPDEIPEEILEYIYGENYKTHLKINYPALKLRLNELAGKRASF